MTGGAKYQLWIYQTCWEQECKTEIKIVTLQIGSSQSQGQGHILFNMFWK